MTNTPLNPDALSHAARVALINSARELGQEHWCLSVPAQAKKVLNDCADALAVAQQVVTGEQVNRAGWTCDGIHEPGSYTTCDDCREACNDLANFYNQMRRTPEATGPWTYRPEVPGA